MEESVINDIDAECWEYICEKYAKEWFRIAKKLAEHLENLQKRPFGPPSEHKLKIAFGGLQRLINEEDDCDWKKVTKQIIDNLQMLDELYEKNYSQN